MSPETESSVGFKIRQAQIVMHLHFLKFTREHPTASRYLGLLAILQANPGTSQSLLAEAIYLKRSSLVPIIDKLESEGLLERLPADGNRRTNSISLTSRGEKVFNDLWAAALEQDEIVCKGLDKQTRDIVINSLNKMIKNCSSILI